jgi:hypothetical protein
MSEAIGYLRVSTREQGRSGLGLAALHPRNPHLEKPVTSKLIAPSHQSLGASWDLGNLQTLSSFPGIY